jgi:uncharacterized protein involved in response to NO
MKSEAQRVMSQKIGVRDGSIDGRASASWTALFSYGFRPFFLGAGIYAVVAMSTWVGWLLTQHPAWLASQGSPAAWHAHEMVFGFAMAAVAGFLLTAVPNWTGALPLSGRPLQTLFTVWVAGRVAMFGAGALPDVFVAAVDLAFVPLLAMLAARQLLVKPAPRNFVFLVLLAGMTIANALYHAAASGLISIDAVRPVRAGLLIIVLMVVIVGGRIVPAFTHNWLHLNAPQASLPRRYAFLDLAAAVSVALFAVCEIGAAPAAYVGSTAVAAALINATRLMLWRGWATWRAPIVWVLHVGYAWIVVGLVMAGASVFVPGVPGSLAMHAFGTGAAGTMVMAVMTRASLGHTGRPLIASPQVVLAYVLVILAALTRTFGILLGPDFYMPLLVAAAVSWIMAYVLFVIAYAPMLTRPRITAGRQAT